MFPDIECVDFDVEFIYNVHFTITDMLTCSNKCLLSKGLNLHNHFVNLKINASNKVGPMTSINLLKLWNFFYFHLTSAFRLYVQIMLSPEWMPKF